MVVERSHNKGGDPLAAGRHAQAGNPGYEDSIYSFFNYLYLVIILSVVLFPLVNILSSSFSDSSAVVAGQVFLLPVNPSLEGYRAVFQNRQIWTGYYNSIIYTVAGTAISVALTMVAAYPLMRRGLPGGGAIMKLMVFTMIFSGGMIPSYLVVNNLGMINTRWAMIIPGAISVYNVIIARTFLKSNIPVDMLEAAQIEGCDDFHFFIRFVLPLSKTIIAVLTLFYAVGNWNAFFSALIYIRRAELFPLQVIIRNILLLSQMADMLGDVNLALQYQGMYDLIKYAVIIVASAPVLMLYPFLQRYFIKGVMIGSLKG